MEQQVAALIQQVMEMSERMRQSEETAEQARQLLESPQNRWADAGGTNEPNGSECGRAQVPEAPGADDGRFGFGAFAARYQRIRGLAIVNKYEPTSKASVVGKLAEILREKRS